MSLMMPWLWPADDSMLLWMRTWLIVISIVIAVIAIALWVLQSIGLMRMARKTGFPDPWLAWIPIASIYLFIKLAGDKKRKLGIAYAFIAVFGTLAAIISMEVLISPYIAATIAHYGSMMATFIPTMLCCIPLFVICITVAVLCFILLYNIFKRFKPDSAVLFLVLSIVFGFLAPLFVFVSSYGKPDAHEAPASD